MAVSTNNPHWQIAKSIQHQLKSSSKAVISGYTVPDFDFSQVILYLLGHIGGIYKFPGSLIFENLNITGNFKISHVEIRGDLIFKNVHIDGILILEDVIVYGNIIINDVSIKDSMNATSLKVKKLFDGDYPKILKFSNTLFGDSGDNVGSIHLFPELEVEGEVVFEDIKGLKSIGMAGAKIIGSLRISDTDIPGILDLKFTQITKDREDPWKIGEPYSPVARPIISISNSRIGIINLWMERDGKGRVIEGYYESLEPTIRFENVSVNHFLVSNRDIIGSVQFKGCVFENNFDFINVKIVGDLIFENCEIKLGGTPNCNSITITEIDHNFDVECTKRIIFQNTRFENLRIRREFLHLARYTLEKNGYDTEADVHFLEEKRAERSARQFTRKCKWYSIGWYNAIRGAGKHVEDAVSWFVDKIVFGVENSTLQFLLVAIFSFVFPLLAFLVLFGLLLSFLFSSLPAFPEVLEWVIADLSCEYGTNWKRPIGIWISIVGIAFPVIYKFHLNLGLFEAVYSSALIAVTLGLGNILGKTSNSITSFLVILEAIFGTFMWAVFLTVFARKFMRK